MISNPIGFDAVEIDPAGRFVKIIDQTLLPGKEVFLELSEEDEIAEAIKSLRVRGAPAIGIAAAAGIAVVIMQSAALSSNELEIIFGRVYEKFSATRPTAVNLKWALDRMKRKFISLKAEYLCAPDRLRAELLKEAQLIKAEDIEMSVKIAQFGLSLINDGSRILTHCNAGHLATGRYGTALAPVYLAMERGINLKVYSCETRPLFQGARLTSFELKRAGADVTLICDNMAATLMQRGFVDAVFTGCDRIAANGDTANKIGTLSLAILARHYSIPFYILGPVSTIDSGTKNGSEIIIEERSGKEITEPLNGIEIAPAGVKTFNPAFDVTPAELITAIITDIGIFRYPYNFSV